MASLRSIALALCLTGSAALQAETAAPHVELQASRDFGYTMGSLIEHRIRLWLPDGAEFLSPLLPSPGAVNDWLDLRTIRWHQESRQVVRIDVTYQVFKGVRDTETAVIPPLPIAYRAGGSNAEIRTPEWPFGLIPLIPPATPDDSVLIRRDAAQAPFVTAPVFYRFIGFSSVALLGALALAFRLGLMPRIGQGRPFARARRELVRLRSHSRAAARYDAGLRLVHEAIDRSHGAPVFPAMLEDFLSGHPAFMPLRPDFEAFFQASQRHFFDPGTDDVEPHARWQALEDFCRRCARLERSA